MKKNKILQRPRLSVFRSNKYIYAQIIDDSKGITLVSYSDKKLGQGEGVKSKVEKAVKVGEELAKIATKKKIGKIVFDRKNYRYHGRIKGLAEGLRKGGLEF